MPSVRRLTAILAADVAGYSRLMGADEEGTHERLKAHLQELVDPKIGEHRGRTVKNTGDGLLAEFQSVVDAVRCAAEVQRGMADREPEVTEERRIRFRIGVNLGDVIVEEHDIFGDGVNVAARLEGLAAPGGICVSGTVRDHIGDRLPYVFEDIGEQNVKNIARPVRVYALRPETIAELPRADVPIALSRRRHSVVAPITAAVAAVLVITTLAWWVWPPTRSSSTTPAAVAAMTSVAQPLVAPRLSIVVLPFANLSNDPEQQYFADGIAEDVTTALSRLAHMFVISRNTAFTYRTRPANTKEIARELGVRYVLEGSVRRSGSQVRVSSQLIDAATDAHLWAERFDRDISDLFALQDDITARIAVALDTELAAAEAARPTDHPDALDYVFRASAALFSKPPTRENYAEVIGLLEQALALDPQSADVQSRLASVLVGRVLANMTSSATADLERAVGLTKQALASSPRSPLAHYAKAQVLRAQRQYAEAIPEYEAALASDRNSVYTLSDIAQCKLWTGSIDETIPLIKRAIGLSPRDPFELGIWYQQIGFVHLLQSRFDEAIIWLEKARNASPALAHVHAQLAAAYGLEGETERAAAELAEARSLSSDDRFSSMARLQAAGSSAVAVMTPKIRALLLATYVAGLRKAGLPEE